MSKTWLGVVFEFTIIIFAIIGLLFASVFVGMRFGLLNVKGTIDERNKFFIGSDTGSTSTSTSIDSNAQTGDSRGLSPVSISDENTRLNLAIIGKIESEFRKNMTEVRKSIFPDISFAWINTSEWQTLTAALTKDKEVIKKAANDASISPRLLVAVVIAEQIRFFTSDRETFKKFFEPLKILGTLSQFSLGVSGVKPDTAKAIEDNLKNPNSEFYISKEYENLLDYETVQNDADRYARLTDSHNHYYSYLYTALFIKEIESQWSRAGYDISNRPEIISTIFNLGFSKSIPKNNPEVAGSVINIGGEKISFGRLSYEFYYSGELLDIFGF
ncbi:MAG: hypothetical protein WCQ00_01535 [bacterium]